MQDRTAGLLEDSRGNVAGVFAICSMLIMGSVGVAIDYSRAQSVKVTLQNGLDAAVLAASRLDTVDSNAIDLAVRQLFAAEPTAKHAVTDLDVSGRLIDQTTISGEVTAKVPVTLMRILGYTDIPLTVRTTVSRAIGNLEIALVLDTTLSMNGAKLDTVKQAANQLIDTVYALPDAADQVKFALVPFAQYVNVGQANRNAPWMDVPADYTVPQTGCWPTYPNQTTSNCRTVTRYGVSDGQPVSWSEQECDVVNGPEVTVCGNWTDTYTWNGCAGARDGYNSQSPLGRLNIWDGGYSNRIPGPLNVWCPSPLQPLTKTSQVVKDSINAMFAQGDTFIPAGLVWGWRALSNRSPFTESADDPVTATGRVRKYIVLMTDGMNTRSPNYGAGDHEAYDSAASDQLTAEVCQNIRNDGIEIFTIAFQVTDNNIKQILRDCATPGGAFFDAIDYSRLLAAFGNIGTGLGVARLAK